MLPSDSLRVVSASACRGRAPLAGCLLLGLLCSASGVEAQRLYRVEASVSGNYQSFDNATELAPALGASASVGYWFRPFSIELAASIARPHTDTPLHAALNVKSLGGALLWNLPIGTYSSAYLRGGYASVTYGGGCPAVSIPGSGPCGSAGALQAATGVRLSLSPTMMIRSEVLVSRSQTALKFSNFVLSGGLSFMLGSKPLVDTDGDRVYDRYDRCAGSPLGALVDKHGCPTDADQDGVVDGLDRCPNTPAGAAVDGIGCTNDGDADGILDGLDKCPDTPKGATADALGCPNDSDHDGVPDGLDRCADTPEGATVDALGCPNDSDNDGVPDGVDKCSNTPPGTRVNLFGCPVNLDSDRDGVPDAADRCPKTRPDTKVDPNGCPIALAPPTPPRGSEPGSFTPPTAQAGVLGALPGPSLALRSANRLAERTGPQDPFYPDPPSGAIP